MVVTMSFRHVRGRGGAARMKPAGVRVNLLAIAPHLHQVFEDVQLDQAANVLMRYGVMVLTVLDVVVDIHLRLFDVPVAPGLNG